MDEYTEFRWYDYLIFSTFLAISLAIGIYYAVTGGKQKTPKEYLLADKNMPTIPVAISLFVTSVSAILILGSTAEFYQHGITYYFAVVSQSIGYALIAVLFVKMVYNMEVTSVFEYLHLRFDSKSVRYLAVVFSLMSSLSYIGLVIYSPSVALEAVTGISTEVSVSVLSIIVIFYTSIGGMKAVIGTDFIQGLIMIGGLLVVLIYGIIKAGGLQTMWQRSVAAGRMDIEFVSDPPVRLNFWSATIPAVINVLASGFSQTTVQRFNTTPHYQLAIRVMLWNIPLGILMWTICYMLGMAVFTYYDILGCDPLRTGQITSSNQLVAFYVMDALQVPGLPGLFVGILYCAALSTMSSQLSALAAITWKDIFDQMDYFSKFTQENKATLIKVLVFSYGLIGLAFSFLYLYAQGNVLQMGATVGSAFGGPVSGMFFLAVFFPCAHWKGVLVGSVAGFLITEALGIGSLLMPYYMESKETNVTTCATMNLTVTRDNGHLGEDVYPLFRLSFYWFSLVSNVVTVSVGLLASIIWDPVNPADVDPRYVVAVFDMLAPCFPKTWRRALWCGVPFASDRSAENYDDLPTKYRQTERTEVDVDSVRL